jgi:flagellar P-ring protein precursor FlgI
MTTNRLSFRYAAALAALIIVWSLTGRTASAHRAPQARLKDIAQLQGMGTTPLLGYGLVVGLNKTGDKRQTLFTTQTLTNLLTRFGVEVLPDEMKVENTAAVLVTAELPVASRAGQRIDVLASSIGDAKSLQGGTLLLTPLHDGSGAIVAMAQGPLSIGGFGGGTGGNSVQVNHLTAGRVPAGGLVQAAPAARLSTGTAQAPSELTLVLNEPDFSTAARLADAVNEEFKARVATPADSSAITIAVPDEYRGQVPQLMARLEAVTVQPDTTARVVINERTGTVVVGHGVTLGPAAVAHGSISVRISTQYDVSQPSPLSKNGQTVVVPQEQVEVRESTARLVNLGAGATLEAVTHALNALGATPRDIIAILQALKAAGALRAELVIL